MAIALDAAAAGNRATGSATNLSTSWTHTVAASTGTTVVLVGVNYSVSTNATATGPAVTYGGGSNFMVNLNERQVGSSTNRAGIATYIMWNPPTGAQTVTVTCQGSGTKTAVAGNSVSYTGVAAVRNAVDAAATGQTVTTVSGDWVFSVTSNEVTISAGGTNRYSAGTTVTGAGDFIVVQDQTAAGTSTSVTTTGTSTTPAVASVILQPSAAAPGGQIVAFDAAAQGNVGGTTSASWTHTASGSNRAVIVGVAVQPTTVTPTVTYGGVSMTSLGSATYATGSVKHTLFYLLAPATGAQTVAVTATSGTYIDANSFSYTAVSAVSGFASATTPTTAVTVTSATGNMAVAYAWTNSYAMGLTQQTRWHPSGTVSNLFAADGFGAASVAFTTTNGTVNAVGANLVAAVAAAVIPGRSVQQVPIIRSSLY